MLVAVKPTSTFPVKAPSTETPVTVKKSLVVVTVRPAPGPAIFSLSAFLSS